MDRRLPLPFLFTLVALISGCVSTPDVELAPTPVAGISEAEIASEAVVSRPPGATPIDGSAVSAQPETPEVSLAAPAPLQFVADADHPAARRIREKLLDEYHLSSDAGWLVLPVPRITDDLPRRADRIVAFVPDRLAEPVPPPVVADRDTNATGALDEGRRVDNVENQRRLAAADTTPGHASDGGVPGGVSSGSGQLASQSGSTQSGSSQSGSSQSGSTQSGSTPLRAPAAVLDDGEVAAAGVSGGVSTGAASNSGFRQTAPEWTNRQATASTGSDVTIVLPGDGWLYVGSEYADGVANLLSKRVANGNDEFVFRFSEDGEYGLWFQRQDGVSGAITNERLGVTASADGSRNVAVADLDAESGAAGTLPGSASGANVATADGSLSGSSPVSQTSGRRPTVSGGETQSPVSASSTAAADSTGAAGPEAWAAIAEEATARGNVPVAAEYWRRVIASGGADAGPARNSLFELALANPDASDEGGASFLAGAVETVRAAGELTQSRLAAAAQAADSAGLYDEAINYYSELTRIGSRDGRDETLFRLAQLLEIPGPQRDLKRARSLYEAVIAEFPLSRYWDESSRQIEYLNRHFFDVR